MIEETAQAEVLSSHPPWKPIDILWTFLAAAAVTALGVLILVLVVPREDGRLAPALLALIGLLSYGALFSSAWFFAVRRRGATLRDAGFVAVPLRIVLLMVPVTIGMMIVQAVVISVSSRMFGSVPSAEQQLGVGDAVSLTALDLVLLLLLGAVAAPLVEEFFFRGLLLRWLTPRMSWALAVGTSALLFAAAHFVPVLIPGLFVMGVVTAWTTRRWKSIVPAIAVHAFNNGLVIWVVYEALKTS